MAIISRPTIVMLAGIAGVLIGLGSIASTLSTIIGLVGAAIFILGLFLGLRDLFRPN